MWCKDAFMCECNNVEVFLMQVQCARLRDLYLVGDPIEVQDIPCNELVCAPMMLEAWTKAGGTFNTLNLEHCKVPTI